ncbi:MAG: glycosyltransferase family 2 protein [Planctomycetota bacterium]|jgi:hypothetical protein
MPRFTILMPTRNRASLLAMALQSAVAQHFDDFEIVVSDNHSADGTADVAQGTGDARVRYVRTPDALPMPDSWEFALGQARGEYVTVLCDDDAVAPGLLERVDSVLRSDASDIVGWTRHEYVHGDWYEEAHRNLLFVSPWSPGVRERSSADSLRKMFKRCQYRSATPMLFNCVCRRRVLEDVRARAGRFFPGPAPDVAAAVMMMSAVPRYTFIGEPLALAGTGRQSIGANAGRDGEAAQRFIKEFPGDVFRHTPFPHLTVTTVVGETLLAAKALLPDAFRGRRLHWPAYYVGTYRDLLAFERAGVDVTAYVRELDALVADLPPWTRWRVKRGRRRLDAGGGRSAARVVAGSEGGFEDIVSCAARLDTLVAGSARP